MFMLAGHTLGGAQLWKSQDQVGVASRLAPSWHRCTQLGTATALPVGKWPERGCLQPQRHWLPNASRVFRDLPPATALRLGTAALRWQWRV